MREHRSTGGWRRRRRRIGAAASAFALVAGCGDRDPSDTPLADEGTATTADATPMTTTPGTSSPGSVSPTMASSPRAQPDRGNGCEDTPVVELESADRTVEMDVMFYQRSTKGCGYNADGAAMFDDHLRPAGALRVTRRALAVAPHPDADISIDIRPLEPRMRLASNTPSNDVLAAANDGTYPISLPGAGCFAVTVDWHIDGRDGRYTATAESTPGRCDDL